MAEERNTGLTAGTSSTPATGGASSAPVATTVTSTDADDTEATKQELQRRMEAARENISNTVAEIKDTVTTQYENVRTTINQNLDWREHVRTRPTTFSIAAGTVGFFIGVAVAGAFSGSRRDDDYTDYEYEYDNEDDTYSPTATARAYRAQSMAGSSYDDADDRSSRAQSYSSSAMTSYDSTSSRESESSGPGLFERFKGTQAFDKLSNEVATIGTRVVDELSHTAQTVVLPMLLGKLKDAVGIDLNTQRQTTERSKVEREASKAQNEALSATQQNAS